MPAAHVLLVTDVAGIGGSEQRLLLLAERIDRRFELSFCVLGATGPLIDRLRALGRSACALDLRGGRDNARVLLRLIALARRSKASIVHGQNRTAAFLASLAGRAGGARAVVATRTYSAHATGGKYAALDRVTSRVADVTVAVSRAAERALIAEGAPRSRLRMIANGVDQAGLIAAASRPERIAGAPTIVSVGNLHEVKGHATLVRALPLVHASLPDARLVLVGEGPLRGDLEALARSLGVADRVEIAGFQRDVAKHLGRASCFVLPSYDEGMSNALLEAMAIGVPTVATEVGGNVEVVEHGSSGLLAPPRDPEALAHAIRRVLTDPDLSDRLSSGARDRVRDHYSIDRMIAAYEDVYDRLLG